MTVYRNLVDSAQAIVLAMRKIAIDCETPSNRVSSLFGSSSVSFSLGRLGLGRFRVEVFRLSFIFTFSCSRRFHLLVFFIFSTSSYRLSLSPLTRPDSSLPPRQIVIG